MWRIHIEKVVVLDTVNSGKMSLTHHTSSRFVSWIIYTCIASMWLHTVHVGSLQFEVSLLELIFINHMSTAFRKQKILPQNLNVVIGIPNDKCSFTTYVNYRKTVAAEMVVLKP